MLRNLSPFHTILGIGSLFFCEPTFAQVDVTAYGVNALINDVANYNSAFGANALATNTTGAFNTAVGSVSLLNNNGNRNAALGDSTLQFNTTGSSNTAIGTAALENNSSGNSNTSVGDSSLFTNGTGAANTALGIDALYFNTSGSENVATGDSALFYNTTGAQNTAAGAGALFSNTQGNNGSAFGFETLYNNTIGAYNNAAGFKTLYSNTTGNYNNGMGTSSLYYNTTGSGNTAVGYGALYNSTTGSGNIGIGYVSGYYIAGGSNNIDFNNLGVSGDSGVLRIGTNGYQVAAYIAGIYGSTITGGAAVIVDSSGHLGVASSSRRYKDDIQPLGSESDRVYELRPVKFRYKEANPDGGRPVQYGLVAEEVAAVMPELAVYNENGQPETVAYQTLPTLLLNELQKEHQVVSTQARQIHAQSEEIAEIRGQLAELRRLASVLIAGQARSGGTDGEGR